MLLCSLICGLVLQVQASTSTPQQAVQGFVAAIQARDAKKAVAYVQGGQVTEDTSRFLTHGQWPTFTVTNLTDTELGSRAIVDFHLKMTMDGSTLENADCYLVLVKVGDSWLIQGNGDHALADMAGYFAHPETLTGIVRQSNSVTCLSNVKQLNLAFLMFTNDYDDVFKLTGTNWTDKVMPYIKDKAILHCPDDKSGKVSYSFNDYLAGKNMTSFANPANLVMVYEGSAHQLTYRHDGKAVVGFADGHAKYIDATQAKSLTWKP